MVDVVADTDVAHGAGLATIMSIRGALIKRWRESTLCEGMVAGIDQAGDLLEPVFPIPGQAPKATEAPAEKDAPGQSTDPDAPAKAQPDDPSTPTDPESQGSEDAGGLG